MQVKWKDLMLLTYHYIKQHTDVNHLMNLVHLAMSYCLLWAAGSSVEEDAHWSWNLGFAVTLNEGVQ